MPEVPLPLPPAGKIATRARPCSTQREFTVDSSLAYAFAFVVGAVVGSFLNVCIYRLPKGLSIVDPPSQRPDLFREGPHLGDERRQLGRPSGASRPGASPAPLPRHSPSGGEVGVNLPLAAEGGVGHGVGADEERQVGRAMGLDGRSHVSTRGGEDRYACLLQTRESVGADGPRNNRFDASVSHHLGGLDAGAARCGGPGVL